MKFIYLAAFLCSLVVMGVVLAGNDGPEPNCCLMVKDTRILLTNIKRYRMQNTPPCSIKAVVFMTVRSKSICSDPEDSWAKWAMCEVDRRTSNKQPADGCRIISPTSPISTLTPVSTESTQFSVGTTTSGPEKNTSQITYSTYKATNKVTTLAVVTTTPPPMSTRTSKEKVTSAKPTTKTTVEEPSTTTSSLPITLTTTRRGLTTPLPVDVKENTISKTTDKIQNVSGGKNLKNKNIMKKKRVSPQGDTLIQSCSVGYLHFKSCI
ncbi:uncharacterized protein LOC127442274 [Myxocyprinus asiaticus]|uniref:uncharacterized protein LOC127442274 n=1 Tax=Myxocyprinus asiaticus TaxID=70543 RepID=UPI002222AE99|nr:uncharacterized protein LOC127442274 [Myxocyprinus asiaticus]